MADKIDETEVVSIIEDSRIIDKIKKRIQDEPTLSHMNILIEIMEEIDEHKGSDKKERAIAIYETVLKSLELYVEEDKLVDSTIDIVIDLTKGKYNINKIKKTGASCLPHLVKLRSTCLPFVSSLFKK